MCVRVCCCSPHLSVSCQKAQKLLSAFVRSFHLTSSIMQQQLAILSFFSVSSFKHRSLNRPCWCFHRGAAVSQMLCFVICQGT